MHLGVFVSHNETRWAISQILRQILIVIFDRFISFCDAAGKLPSLSAIHYTLYIIHIVYTIQIKQIVTFAVQKVLENR